MAMVPTAMPLAATTGLKSARVASSFGEAPPEPLSKKERDLAVCQLKEDHGAAIPWKQVAELVGLGLYLSSSAPPCSAAQARTRTSPYSN